MATTKTDAQAALDEIAKQEGVIDGAQTNIAAQETIIANAGAALKVARQADEAVSTTQDAIIQAADAEIVKQEGIIEDARVKIAAAWKDTETVATAQKAIILAAGVEKTKQEGFIDAAQSVISAKLAVVNDFIAAASDPVVVVAPPPTTTSPPPTTTPPVPTSTLAAKATTTPTYETLGFSIVASGTTSIAPTSSGGMKLSYRVSGSKDWKTGIDLWWDARFNEYKGAALLLIPGTIYEFMATHDNGQVLYWSASTRIDVSHLPIAKTIPVVSQKSLLTVSSGGSETGYVVYKGQGGGQTILDAERTRQFCMQVTQGTHIIFSGIRFTGALHSCVLLGTSTNSNAAAVGDIIFDGCEYDNWAAPGSTGCKFSGNLQAGIYSASTALKNVTVQASFFHDPAYGANSWKETSCVGGSHPEGSQALVFKGSKGGHVVRWNTVRNANAALGFNDSMGETANFGDAGFPYGHCDIYHNWLANMWDDALELEGRMENVRVWGNFVDQTYIGIGLAAVYRGPVYVFDNVWRHSRTGPSTAWSYGQDVVKSRRMSGTKDYGGGKHYFFNNTTLKGVGNNYLSKPNVAYRSFIKEFSQAEHVSNFVTRNNVIGQDTSDPGITVNYGSGNDFDFDLMTHAAKLNHPGETHGKVGNAIYVAGYGMDDKTMLGNFRQTSASPGYGCAEPVPFLHDGIAKPDMGAHQSSDPKPFAVGHLNMPAS